MEMHFAAVVAALETEVVSARDSASIQKQAALVDVEAWSAHLRCIREECLLPWHGSASCCALPAS